MTVNSWAYGTVILLQTIFALMCSCNHISVTMVTRIPEQYNLRGLLEVTTRSKATESLIGSSRTNYFIMRYIFAFLSFAESTPCDLQIPPSNNGLSMRHTDRRTVWLTGSVTAGWTPGVWLTDWRLRIASFLCKYLVCSTLLCFLDDYHWSTSN